MFMPHTTQALALTLAQAQAPGQGPKRANRQQSKRIQTETIETTKKKMKDTSSPSSAPRQLSALKDEPQVIPPQVISSVLLYVAAGALNTCRVQRSTIAS